MLIAYRQGLEALLFLAAEPVSALVLAEALELDDDTVEDLCQELAQAYRDEERGLAVRRAGGGWRMYTAEPAWPVVERHVLAGRTGRLSSAALETLAVVAYKQPITRGGVGEIRGVNADGAIRSLVSRGYVEEVGREQAPGQPVLYGTTERFLEDLGLDALQELPELEGYLPDDAPDEPGDLRAARKLLASGGTLPRGRDLLSDMDDDDSSDPYRSDSDDSDDSGGDGDQDTVDVAAEARERRARDDAAMDDLTSRLEVAAKSAMSQLREAVAASEQDAAGQQSDPQTTDDDTAAQPDPDAQPPTEQDLK
jgi:segregation and condensation protein B